MPEPRPAPFEPRADGAPARIHWTLLAVQLTFSGFHVLGKFTLASIEPLALASMRVLFAAPVLLLLAWRHDRLLPPLRELPTLAMLGLLGVAANQVLFVVGLEMTTATNAAILMPSIPVFAAGVAALAGAERIGRRRLAGIALTVAGALVVLNPVNFSAAPEARLGNLVILVNCLCYATFLVLQRPVLARLPWRTVIAWSFLFGAAGVLLVGGGRLAALEPGGVPAAAWWSVGYILLFPTLLAYWLSTWAVGRGSGTLVAAYTTVQPLLTAALASAALGESPGWRQAASFALIAAGLWRVSRR